MLSAKPWLTQLFLQRNRVVAWLNPRLVSTLYWDQHVKRSRLRHAPAESLGFVPDWWEAMTAESVARAGARILRGGAFKPRTSPYSFQGLGVEGLRLLRQAADGLANACDGHPMPPLIGGDGPALLAKLGSDRAAE